LIEGANYDSGTPLPWVGFGLIGYTLGLRQSNNLKTIAKLEKYKMYGIDTGGDKSRYFDLMPLIS
jgi:hypothetical protein